MAAQKNRYSSINLLPKDPFSESSLGKFLNWALTTGRYIVIFTELIVIIAFISRFALDRRLNNINESILTKQAKIQAFQELETKIRGLQEKGKFVNEIISVRHPAEWMAFVLEKTPADIVYDQFSVSTKEQISLRGISFSQESLSNLISQLKQDPGIDEVILSTVETNERSAGISFALQIRLKNQI